MNEEDLYRYDDLYQNLIDRHRKLNSYFLNEINEENLNQEQRDLEEL